VTGEDGGEKNEGAAAAAAASTSFGFGRRLASSFCCRQCLYLPLLSPLPLSAAATAACCSFWCSCRFLHLLSLSVGICLICLSFFSKWFIVKCLN
jgi:hypothetical protein